MWRHSPGNDEMSPCNAQPPAFPSRTLRTGSRAHLTTGSRTRSGEVSESSCLGLRPALEYLPRRNHWRQLSRRSSDFGGRLILVPGVSQVASLSVETMLLFFPPRLVSHDSTPDYDTGGTSLSGDGNSPTSVHSPVRHHCQTDLTYSRTMKRKMRN